MWQLQLDTGEYIDTPLNFSLGLELNNSVFSGSDAGSLPGSFSFPAEVPLSGRNMRIFGHPHLPESAGVPRSIANVTVLADGIPLLRGTLKIQSASAVKVKFTIIATPISDLKDIELRSLDLEGTRGLIPFTVEGLMAATCDNPEDFDFVFLHVFGGRPWLPTETNDATDFQNLYNSSTQQFTPYAGGAITPFLKLEYILKRIFALEKNGYQFRNAFQTDTELKRLYLYNNTDLRVRSGSTIAFPTQIDLTKHLPKMKITDLLKKVCAMFNIGLYVNFFEKTITLAPVRDTLYAAPKHDWTAFAVADPLVEYANEAPDRYAFDAFEELPANMPPVREMRAFTDFQQHALAGTIPEEWIYIRASNIVWNTKWNFVATGINNLLWGAHSDAVAGNVNGTVFNPGIVPLPGGFDYHRTNGAGFSKFEQESGQWKFVEKDAPLALMLYRGRQRGDRFPCCGNTPYFSGNAVPATKMNITTGPAGTVEAAARHSINWDGDEGLYARWHADWNNILRNGRHVTQTFRLPISYLARFSFADKVRVGALDYICKKIRIGKTDAGKALCEVSMVSLV